MPAKYGKAYVERGKTDAGDAAAICEAVGVSVRRQWIRPSAQTDQPLLRKPRRQTRVVTARTFVESGHLGRFNPVRRSVASAHRDATIPSQRLARTDILGPSLQLEG